MLETFQTLPGVLEAMSETMEELSGGSTGIPPFRVSWGHLRAEPRVLPQLSQRGWREETEDGVFLHLTVDYVYKVE